MKKVILFFSVLFLSASLSFGQVSATYLELSLGNLGAGIPAGSVWVPITIEDLDGGWSTGQFFIMWDPAFLTPVVDATGAGSYNYPSAFFPFYEWLNNAAYLGSDHEMALTWMNLMAVNVFPPPGEVMVEIEFTYTGDPDYSPLTWNFSPPKDSPDVEKGVTGAWNQDGIQILSDVIGATYPGSVGPPPVLATTWDGSESTDWFDGNNWDTGLVPTGLDDVVVPVGMPNDPVIETDDIALEVAEANDLTNDATITINPFGYLSVYGTFTNNGSMLMLSNATDQASYIGGAVGGTFQYDRYLGVNMALPEEERGWHYISTPVAGFGSWNMFDYYLNTWDEPTSFWVQHAGQPDCTPAPEIFNNGMDGWSVKWDELYDTYGCTNLGTGMTVEYMGAPNYGDQLSAVTSTGVGVYPGFNLVGNPYPSYWNYNDFYFGPNWPGPGLIMDAIYFWDEDANQYASYVNGVGVNGGGPYVPPAQAFFFETTTNEGLTFTDAERIHVYGLPYWKDATDLVRLLATANGFTDETVIHFNENSTVNRDNNDARKLMSGGSTVPSMYTMASGIALSINGMPATVLVPVYFECKTAGTYTIEATETSSFAHIVLEDLLLGTQTSLLDGAYTFDHVAGADPDRFILHFTQLGIGDNLANSIDIWSNDHKIYVQAPEINGDIVVFNMMGQEVIRTEIEPGLNILPVSNVNTYYVVRVVSNDVARTGKVYVK